MSRKSAAAPAPLRREPGAAAGRAGAASNGGVAGKERFGLSLLEGGKTASGSRLIEVAVDSIEPNPHQPRRTFSEHALRQMAASLRERGLVHEPAVIANPDRDGHYWLVAGERRWRAWKLNGNKTIPVVLRTKVETGDLRELALVENLLREDLSPMEEAHGFRALVEDGRSQAAIARTFQISESEVSKTIGFLELHDVAQDLLDSGELTKGHGAALLAERDYDRQRSLALSAVREGWTVRRLEKEITPSPTRSRRGRPPIPADQRAAADRMADVIGKATGWTVTVSARHNDAFLFEIGATDFEEAKAISVRLGASPNFMEESGA